MRLTLSLQSQLSNAPTTTQFHFIFPFHFTFPQFSFSTMAAATQLHLPPGFRFHPTDEELVVHYLCRKCASQEIAVPIIAEIDLYKYDPWDLPGKLTIHKQGFKYRSWSCYDLIAFVCIETNYEQIQSMPSQLWFRCWSWTHFLKSCTNYSHNSEINDNNFFLLINNLIYSGVVLCRNGFVRRERVVFFHAEGPQVPERFAAEPVRGDRILEGNRSG